MTSDPQLRNQADVPTILQLIHELASYEHALHEVLATEASLLNTLSFPSNPSRGYAKTLLITPADPLLNATPPAKGTDTLTPTTPPNLRASTKPAGMALYFHNYSTWRSAPGIFLEDLFVRPEYRGCGYGTALLRELARECLRLGCQRLEWNVLKWNEPSIRFYQGRSVGATRMEEWVGMRVEGEEGLRRLIGGEE